MSDPVTAPELVTQIETMHGILAYNGSQVVCACDRTWKPAEDYAAHIARAVLAALTEAGTVEWGVRWHVGGCSVINRCTSKRHAERQAAELIESGHEAAVVSRLTLPWGRAE